MVGVPSEGITGLILHFRKAELLGYAGTVPVSINGVMKSVLVGFGPGYGLEASYLSHGGAERETETKEEGERWKEKGAGHGGRRLWGL
jgi:hypothetical protein